MRIFSLFAVIFTAQLLFAQTYKINGIEKDVEIIIDTWGIPHIYAQTEKDLFFAQGWNAARDRLFQFEIWRRQATGTTAEILGPSALKRDIGTRLFMFRGDIEAEMNHYHERGSMIITSFTEGVNAYISYILEHEDELPLEFKLLGIKPQQWTPEVVISRHQGLLGNIGNELSTARQVSALGIEKTKEFNYFHPQDPDLQLDDAIDPKWFEDDILELYNAFRRPVRFSKDDLLLGGISDNDARGLAETDSFNELLDDEENSIGSNNWILSGEHTASGYPIMANDPHRAQSVPSLRYMSHLVGPGWNVIGGGEPEIPGISIGHNEYGAWGLTVYSTDAEDLYVYKVNELNTNEYWYKGQWKTFEVITDTIKVKGAPDEIVRLEYTVHGPVAFRNESENVAFAIRCGWLEKGGSPYLASLRMNQARNFEEFRLACHYSHIPGENMIWADRAGNIGWQAVGIAPVRKNWSGLVPVPGDGRYEWDGYLPIMQKPNLYNPERGMFSTANQNVTPQTYNYWEAIGFNWADAYRGDRVKEVLQSGRKFTVHDMAALQTDYYAMPARALVPMLRHLKSQHKNSNEALDRINKWKEYELAANSIEAAIYVEWEIVLKDRIKEKLLPEDKDGMITMPLTKVIERLVYPDGNFGKDPMAGRDQFLIACFDEAVENLEGRLGEDQRLWQYGQEKNKHIKLFHPLGRIVSSELQDKLNVGPHPRGGYGYTVGSTSNSYNQVSGASFKVIIDTGNWDHALFTNNPGQSGNPDSPFYKNLFDYWAKDKYFPMFYSRDKIKSTEAQTINLSPVTDK